MTEIAFPVLGTAFVVLVVLPLFAAVAKVGLTLLERDEAGGPLHGLNARYLLLIGASVLPIAWLVSAGLHQVEAGSSVISCLFDHDSATPCFEPGSFALLLAIGVLVVCLRALRGSRQLRPSRSDAARLLRARLDRLIAVRPALVGLRGLVVVSEEPSFAIGTRGLFRPRVFVGLAFASELTDDMLGSALGHENEHVQSLDPLRYLLLELALGVNPVGRFLLSPHVARWRAAREAHCDREAVVHGAAPIPLADAIVRAARPVAVAWSSIPLGTDDTAMLKLRIRMLLAFAEKSPDRCCSEGRSAIPVTVVLLSVALVLPHQTGTQALDALHSGSEHALTYVLR